MSPFLILLWVVALGALAGADRGLSGAVIGGAIMLAIYGPFYLLGLYERRKYRKKESKR